MIWSFDVVPYIAASNDQNMPLVFQVLPAGFAAGADIWSFGRVSASVFRGKDGLLAFGCRNRKGDKAGFYAIGAIGPAVTIKQYRF